LLEPSLTRCLAYCLTFSSVISSAEFAGMTSAFFSTLAKTPLRKICVRKETEYDFMMVFLSLGLILISLSMGKKAVRSIPFLRKSDFFILRRCGGFFQFHEPLEPHILRQKVWFLARTLRLSR